VSASVQCAICGVVFAPFGGAEAAVDAFNAHSCAARSARDRHPSNRTWTPRGAA